MPKMRPLAIHQQALSWLCVSHQEENSNQWRKFAQISFTVLVFVVNIFGLVSSFIYFTDFVLTDLAGSLYGLLQGIGMVTAVYSLVINLALRREIIGVYNYLDRIYKGYENEPSFRFLIETNDKCEWICKMFFKYVMGAFSIVVTLICIASVWFSWFMMGQFDVHYVYHSYRVIVPWNQRTLLGYLAESAFIVSFAETYFISNGAVAVPFLAICWHHQAFYQMFREKLNQLNVESGNDKIVLCELIQFHTSVKDWFSKTAAVYSYYLSIQATCTVLILACEIYALDLQLENINFDTCTFFLAGTVSFTNLFVYCFFADMATDSFDKMCDCLFECKWFECHTDMQKYFILLMVNAQRRLQYDGSGIIILNLQTYGKLLRSVVSYYMILKTVASK